MFTFFVMNEALKSLKDYWFIIVFIGTLIVTWTQFDSRISSLERNDSAQDTKIETIIDKLSDFQTGQAEIKTTVEFIKNNLVK
jgi:uncharacterized coiled-coil protein SlyX